MWFTTTCQGVRVQAFMACAEILENRKAHGIDVRAERPGRQSPEPLADDERCIRGQRFRKVGNEWLQLAADCA